MTYHKCKYIISYITIYYFIILKTYIYICIEKKIQMYLLEDSHDSKCSSTIKTSIMARDDKTPIHFHLGDNQFDF